MCHADQAAGNDTLSDPCLTVHLPKMAIIEQIPLAVIVLERMRVVHKPFIADDDQRLSGIVVRSVWVVGDRNTQMMHDPTLTVAD